MAKTNFWDNRQYYGLDLSVLKAKAVKEKFS